MSTRGVLISFCCVILAAAIVDSWPISDRTDKVKVIVVAKPVDSSVFDESIVVKGFSKREEALIREALLPKLGEQCREAFHAAGLPSPWQVAWESGIVIQYSRDLYVKEAGDLGLLYTETRNAYQVEFSTCRAQGGTVPYILDGMVLTTDGKPHIFLHDSAFVGRSFWLGTVSLSDVLTHELLHAAGQPPTPGWLGPLSHDLAGLKNYDEIIEACR